MIIFIYGEDTYRSRRKLNEIVAKFEKTDSSGMNLVTLDMGDKNFADFSKAVTAPPFLGSQRLVIAKNLLGSPKADTQEAVIELISDNKISVDTTLVVFEYQKVDKRKKLYKLLSKSKQSQEFKILKDWEVANWIKDEVARRQGKIESDAVAKLASYVGNDLWKMDNEITKLGLYCQSRAITAADIELLVKARLDENVFNLVDAIGNQNVKKSLSLLHDQFAQGENELRLLSMITYQFRNIAQIQPLVADNISNQEIKNITGLHPFVVGKTVNQSRRFSTTKIKHIYNMLVRTDLAMKTSKLDKQTALDLLVVSLCS